MSSIPANIKGLKPLLCFALALDAILCIIAFSSPGQGYACGIEGTVLPNEADTVTAVERSDLEDEFRHIVILVKNPETDEIVAKLKPDEYGYFKAHLRPGKYLLVVQSEEGVTVLSDAPRIVDVGSREFSSVTFRVETGPNGRGKNATPSDTDAGF